MSRTESSPPGIMGVYGSKISYYTGKFETYLRYRGIDYESFPTVAHSKKLIEGVGIVQMPVVQLADGRWMTDTTPMIAWLETQQTAPSIYPESPLLRFVALLIEDYADEWLWRSAMHYRWSYRLSRQYAAEFLYAELVRGTLPLPRFLAINMLKRRQLFGFVWRDGVHKRSRRHADQTYLAALDCLQAIFEHRPFLLGQTPTIADFGMMAPMFRHFSQDPTPAEIMRDRAPLVYEWVTRMWTAQPTNEATDLIEKLDLPIIALLKEISQTLMEQHRQNALAYSAGRPRYNLAIQNYTYPKVPTSRYRVWCLEALREVWQTLPDDAQQSLDECVKGQFSELLSDRFSFRPSEYDLERQAPFNRAINVFKNGVP
ncbi:MAG: glutathione S-transferase [Pseudomonadota bacterium]